MRVDYIWEPTASSLSFKSCAGLLTAAKASVQSTITTANCTLEHRNTFGIIPRNKVKDDIQA
jgi:hypothetical protein